MKTMSLVTRFVLSISCIALIGACAKEDAAVTPDLERIAGNEAFTPAVQPDAPETWFITNEGKQVTYSIKSELNYEVIPPKEDAVEEGTPLYKIKGEGEGIWPELGTCQTKLSMNVDPQNGQVKGRIDYMFPEYGVFLRFRLRGSVLTSSSALGAEVKTILKDIEPGELPEGVRVIGSATFSSNIFKQMQELSEFRGVVTNTFSAK